MPLPPFAPASRPSTLLPAALLAVAALGGCASAPPPEPQAIVELRATQLAQPIPGRPVTGTVRLMQRGNEVVLRGQIDHLQPGGAHGFYIYENGDCSAPDAMSAGSHFNPTRRQHSYGGSGHAGDLPLLMADPRNGSAEVLYATTQFTLTPGPLSVIGKAVIVHRDPDSPALQPDGNAGPRLACGVIQAVTPARK